MRGKRAKVLRKKVYGIYSQKGKRQYINEGKGIRNAPNGLRAKYQAAKKED